MKKKKLTSGHWHAPHVEIVKPDGLRIKMEGYEIKPELARRLYALLYEIYFDKPLAPEAFARLP